MAVTDESMGVSKLLWALARDAPQKSTPMMARKGAIEVPS